MSEFVRGEDVVTPERQSAKRPPQGSPLQGASTAAGLQVPAAGNDTDPGRFDAAMDDVVEEMDCPVRERAFQHRRPSTTASRGHGGGADLFAMSSARHW